MGRPPPNPAKITDTRAAAYIREFGGESWELDALEPAFIEDLIQQNIAPLIDGAIVEQTRAVEREQKKDLQLIADNYHSILARLKSA